MHINISHMPYALFLTIRKILLGKNQSSKKLWKSIRAEQKLSLEGNVLTWYIGNSKSLICFYHLWSKPISAEISFFSPFRWSARGDDLITNRPKWTFFSHQIQKNLWMINGCSKQKSFPWPLAEGLIEAFFLQYFCKILWLIMWNHAYAWWCSVISLTKIQ